MTKGSKFKREYELFYGSKCDFTFYKQTGCWGMYCNQVRHNWFCIPFIIGFRYSISW